MQLGTVSLQYEAIRSDLPDRSTVPVYFIPPSFLPHLSPLGGNVPNHFVDSTSQCSSKNKTCRPIVNVNRITQVVMKCFLNIVQLSFCFTQELKRHSRTLSATYNYIFHSIYYNTNKNNQKNGALIMIFYNQFISAAGLDFFKPVAGKGANLIMCK